MTWGVPLLVSYHFAFSYCSWGFQGKNTEVACHFLLQWTTFCQKWKKAEWLSREDLQIAVKRREAKSKGEKERYKHLNVEFQRIAKRDKKGFLSNQCKEIEENNRMGKTRDLFKKIRDTKGTFHAKMGSIKDRNGMYGPNRSRRY